MSAPAPRIELRAAAAVLALIWIPWLLGLLLTLIGLDALGSRILLLWHILFLPFRAVYVLPGSELAFSPLLATLLDIATWLAIALAFGLLARRLATRWQLALSPLVVIAGGRLLVHAILLLGFNIDYDGP